MDEDSRDRDGDKGKALVYKVVTATTLVIPFDPEDPDKVDASNGSSEPLFPAVIQLKRISMCGHGDTARLCWVCAINRVRVSAMSPR